MILDPVKCFLECVVIVSILAVAFSGSSLKPKLEFETVSHLTTEQRTGAHGIPYCSMTRIDGVCEAVQGEGYDVCRAYINRRGQKRIGYVGNYRYLVEAQKAYRGG